MLYDGLVELATARLVRGVGRRERGFYGEDGWLLGVWAEGLYGRLLAAF